MINRLRWFVDWHKSMQNLTRFGLRILAALALLLVGANPSGSAQAAPGSPNFFTFLVNAIPSADYVCTGEYMYFTVSISKQLISRPGDTGSRLGEIRDVYVVPHIGDTDVISTIDTAVQIGSAAVNSPTSARLWFKAGLNPGRTTLQFSSDISHFFMGNYEQIYENAHDHAESPLLPIEVRDCGYKVLTIFQMPAGEFGMLTATTTEIQLDKVSRTHFVGTTDFPLAYSNLFVYGCWFKVLVELPMVAYSADLLGERGERLVLNFTVQKYKITSSATGVCDTGVSQSYETSPGTWPVIFPAEGGVRTYYTPYWTYLIIVTRVSE